MTLDEAIWMKVLPHSEQTVDVATEIVSSLPSSLTLGEVTCEATRR
jgi:hypothetical protein